MEKTKQKNNILDALNNLDKSDTYSLLLFILYKLKDDKEYSTLSELSYILDHDSLINLLDYYGGMTIHIPTKAEFRVVIETLLLYQKVNEDNLEYSQALKDTPANYKKDVEDMYMKVIEMLENYNIKSRKRDENV